MPSHQDRVLEPGLEHQRVIRWRQRELVRAGYDMNAARRLAEAPDVDLHRALQLRRVGCDVELALRILL